MNLLLYILRSELLHFALLHFACIKEIVTFCVKLNSYNSGQSVTLRQKLLHIALVVTF